MKTELEDYDDEWYENQPLEYCPNCRRDYDHLDFDYQACSWCGHGAEED